MSQTLLLNIQTNRISIGMPRQGRIRISSFNAIRNTKSRERFIQNREKGQALETKLVIQFGEEKDIVLIRISGEGSGICGRRCYGGSLVTRKIARMQIAFEYGLIEDDTSKILIRRLEIFKDILIGEEDGYS